MRIYNCFGTLAWRRVAFSAAAALTVAGFVASASCSSVGHAKHVGEIASVFVSPVGVDARCLRGDAQRPCASFDRAYAIARPGDVVEMAAGTYGPQTILTSVAQGKPGQDAVVFRAAQNAQVSVNGDVALGVDGVTTAPSNVSFDGRDTTTINGHFSVNYGGGPKPTGDSLLNTHLRDPTDSEGAMVFTREVSDFASRGNDIGPACCSSDGIGIEIRNSGDPTPDHITITGNTIHDLYDSCQEWPTSLGPCSGPGYGDGNCSAGNCDHIDGIQAFGGLTMDIERNAILLQGDHKQGIFLQPANGGSFSDVTIANNAIAATSDTALSVSGPGAGLFSGYLKVLYNTDLGNFQLYDSLLVPGTAVTVAGNIFQGQAGNQSGGGCTMTYSDGSVLLPRWSHNLLGSSSPCGPGDIRGRGHFVQDSFSGGRNPDLRLLAGSPGLGSGDPAIHPLVDIQGLLRPRGWPPDMGAAQHETAAILSGRSIGAARLGATEAEIRAFYGAPRAMRRVSGSDQRAATYRLHGGELLVRYDAERTVVGLETTSPYYSTRSGLQPRSTLPLRKLPAVVVCQRSSTVTSNGWPKIAIVTARRGGVAKIKSVSVGVGDSTTC